MKQTAVEWLMWEMSKLGLLPGGVPDQLYQKAKAMEKEQTMTFAKLWEKKLLDGRIDSVDDLYNETYGK